MKYLQIDSQLFINNRKKFISKLKENTLAIFNSNDIMPTNADGTMPFKQNNDLFWLSGVDQEESVLVIFPNNEEKEILFLKETSELIAIWEGSKLTKEEALNTSGVTSVYWLSEMEERLSHLISKCDGIYLNKNIHSRSASKVQTRDDRFRNMISEKYDKEILESAPIMHELRSIKSDIEISLLQNACNITEKGLRRILPLINPGIMEYEIEAELMHEFLRNRS
ncbi:MAG TPA: aminopeptidase P N-terminal domain-containing protein, partial [Flavobacteriales bacterium]|nr:aminopeptidase P N-terminal domain-containing protein [Flavobacteriales bacterium]